MSFRALPWLFSAIAGLFLVGGLLRLLAAGGDAVPTGGPLRGEVFQADPPQAVVVEHAEWTEPGSQSGGADWVFEVFTPPIIYFNPETRTFTLTPPLERTSEPPFGLELVNVKRELYRLQYAAHLGAEGRYLIEVRNRETGAYERGRVGDRFPEADFTIEDFSAERHLVQPEDPALTPYVETVVRLTIRDERLGESVKLSQQPRLGDRPLVVVRAADGRVHELLPGEILETGDSRFVVLEATPEGLSARIEKRGSDGALQKIADLQLPPGPPSPAR